MDFAFQLTAKQIRLEELYKGLMNECARRKVQLGDASRYHAFVHQIDDLFTWLHGKLVVTKQDNSGQSYSCRFLYFFVSKAVRLFKFFFSSLHCFLLFANGYLRRNGRKEVDEVCCLVLGLQT